MILTVKHIAHLALGITLAAVLGATLCGVPTRLRTGRSEIRPIAAGARMMLADGQETHGRGSGKHSRA